MSTWSRASKRTYLLEGNGFVTSEGKTGPAVPGPNSYNTHPTSPRIRGTMTYAPIHGGKSDREKILSNGVRVSAMSPLGPGSYNPRRVAGPGSPRSVPQGTSPDRRAAASSARGNRSNTNSDGSRGGVPQLKPFGSGTQRGELYPDKEIPGPGDYDLSLPSLSKRGKFIDTSPRKCCSPVEKDLIPVLTQSQQQWMARTQGGNNNNSSGSNNNNFASMSDCGLSHDSLGGSFGRGGAAGGAKNYHNRNGTSPPQQVLDMGMMRMSGSSIKGGGGGSSPPHPLRSGLSPALSDSGGGGRLNISNAYNNSAYTGGSSPGNSPASSPRGPKIKGGTISNAPRPMNMHNLNSTLPREKDPDFANPSPGAYEANFKKSKDRQLGGRISQSPRNCSLVNPKSAGVPGPGTYELMNQGMGSSFGPSGL